ncbi:MAG: aquaporin [Akkermansiaceae bacterium]|nr:aquaporin [Akkermansiaceae bacterium]
MTPLPPARHLIPEFLGTFFLVFAGTGAIIVDHTSGGRMGHVGVSLVFGLVVFAMIRTFRDTGGTHFNPAVTIGLAVAGRFRWSLVAPCIAVQLAGAFAASGMLRVLFPDSPTLGETVPASGIGQAFVLEAMITAALVFVILSVPTDEKENGITSDLAIGATVAVAALFAGPVTGASMNPARSLAPALVGGHLLHLWLYPAATLCGAVLAVPLCATLRREGCCGRGISSPPAP